MFIASTLRSACLRYSMQGPKFTLHLGSAAYGKASWCLLQRHRKGKPEETDVTAMCCSTWYFRQSSNALNDKRYRYSTSAMRPCLGKCASSACISPFRNNLAC